MTLPSFLTTAPESSQEGRGSRLEELSRAVDGPDGWQQEAAGDAGHALHAFGEVAQPIHNDTGLTRQRGELGLQVFDRRHRPIELMPEAQEHVDENAREHDDRA
jgi:hypothetical protein